MPFAGQHVRGEALPFGSAIIRAQPFARFGQVVRQPVRHVDAERVLRCRDRAMHGRSAAVFESAAEARARRAQYVDLVGEDGLLVGEHDLAVVGLEVVASFPLGVVSDHGIPRRASVYHCVDPAIPLDSCQRLMSEDTDAPHGAVAVRPLLECLDDARRQEPSMCKWVQIRVSGRRLPQSLEIDQGAHSRCADNNNRS